MRSTINSSQEMQHGPNRNNQQLILSLCGSKHTKMLASSDCKEYEWSVSASSFLVNCSPLMTSSPDDTVENLYYLLMLQSATSRFQSVTYPMFGAEVQLSAQTLTKHRLGPQFDSQHHKNGEGISCFNGNTESILKAYAAVGGGAVARKTRKKKYFMVSVFKV